jgi:tetratricopeptide (TPR) repeat protein
MRICAIVLGLIAGPVWAQSDNPVGVVLTATASFIQRRGVETQITAEPGIELRPGDHLRSIAGVRFAFCPTSSEQTLLPGHDLVISQATLPNTPGLFGDVKKLPSCVLPPASAPESAGLREGVAAAEHASGSKVDLLGATQRALSLDHNGDHAAAREEYRKIAADYPAAAWTRGVIVRSPSRSGELHGKTYALLIGISEYPPEAPLRSLQYAHADALAFAEFLKTPKGGAIPTEQIKLLINAQATRDGIDSAVHSFVNLAAGPNNTLIIFVAGHADFLVTEQDPVRGDVIHREPYILTADVYRQDVKSTGFRMAELRALIAQQTLQFGRVIVYLDVCHAGYLRDLNSERDLEPAVKLVFSNHQGNVGVMLASEANKFAFEADEFAGHGAFAYTVLAGLNGGAVFHESRIITFADLFRFVVNGVGDLTNNTQVPDKFVNDDQMAVLDDVTKNPGIVLPKARPLPELATRRRRDSNANAPVPQRRSSDFKQAISEFAREAKADPLSALPKYQRIASDPSVSEADKARTAEILHVALDEYGQQILIQYLHGEQIPQNKPAFELGARYFEEALRLPQGTAFDESRMLFCKGRALIFDGEESHYQQAVRLLERSILLDPDHGYAYNALGIAYLEQVRRHPEFFSRAIAAFHDALRFAPDWAYPMHNLALTWSEQGNFAAAAANYRQAMRLAPQYSYLPYNFALMNQRMNRLDEADQLYRVALSDAEKNRESGVVPSVTPWKERADILNGLGSVAALRRRFKIAQDYYERALRDDPDLAAAKYNLAALLSRGGPSLRAVELWRENIAAQPREPSSRLALAEYFETNGDKMAAMLEYEGAVQAAPKHVDARRVLARLYASSHRWQDAFGQLTQARALAPEDVEVVEALGDAEMQIGRSGEAREAYRNAAMLATTRADRKRIEMKLRALLNRQ